MMLIKYKGSIDSASIKSHIFHNLWNKTFSYLWIFYWFYWKKETCRTFRLIFCIFVFFFYLSSKINLIYCNVFYWGYKNYTFWKEWIWFTAKKSRNFPRKWGHICLWIFATFWQSRLWCVAVKTRSLFFNKIFINFGLLYFQDEFSR